MLTFVESPGPLDDYAIASRLSYALWTDTPDETLLRLAAGGELRNKEVLTTQIDRMLDDPRSKQFINSFTDQWLKLNEIDFTTPDTRQFRTFDPVVQNSMLQETRTYISKLIKQDLSVARFVDSDFACLNERLLRHYRVTDDVKGWQRGKGIQIVSLAPSSRRGGLITQGAILKVWTTNAFLKEAFEVIEAWGFHFKSCLVWIKPQMGMGNYWRVSHEFLLLGVKGSLPFTDRTCRSWILHRRTRHSRKPFAVRELIERVSPAPYLEMYGREEQPQSDWTIYGNQVERRLF